MTYPLLDFHRSQQITLRLIANQLLPEADKHRRTYVHGELSTIRPQLQPPAREFHVYCSDSNYGAIELLNELLIAGLRGVLRAGLLAPHRSTGLAIADGSSSCVASCGSQPSPPA